jgi:hypothetical protein
MQGKRLTVCVTCVWAGVDSAWKQEKLEARKILENAAESHTSGARCVGRFVLCMIYCLNKKPFHTQNYFTLSDRRDSKILHHYLLTFSRFQYDHLGPTEKPTAVLPFR